LNEVGVYCGESHYLDPEIVNENRPHHIPAEIKCEFEESTDVKPQEIKVLLDSPYNRPRQAVGM
jgi:hypothetical protein